MSDKLEAYENENQKQVGEQVGERAWVAPRVDIFENENEVLLLADVPGVDRRGLTINLDKEELTLEGRVEARPPDGALGREFSSVDYRRKFIVPPGIDVGKIAAELKHGVLRLHLPKSDALKPRQIQVRAG